MRNNHANTKGVTLVELLAVIVIMGIIVSISVVTIGRLISRTTVKAYEATVSSLNQATQNYVLMDNVETDDAFEGLDTNSERISLLFSLGYISQLPQPMAPYSFVWDIESQLWILSDEEVDVIPPSQINYNFEEDSLTTVIEEGGLIASGSFTDNGDSISTDLGVLFIDNNKDSYTILVREKLTISNYGGVGIFYETTLNENNEDTGFIVQFDRGSNGGQVVIRPRINGQEKAIIYSFDIGFDNNGEGDFVVSGGTKNRVNPWWIQEHDLKVVVADNNDPVLNKKISFYVDDEYLFTYTFTSAITPETQVNNQTGIRVWTANTFFYSFKVE